MKALLRRGDGWRLWSLFDDLRPGPTTTLPSWRTIAGNLSTDPSLSEACLARNERIRSRLKAARVNPSRTDTFTRPKTRKNPRVRSTKEPLSAAFTDSTTWRLPMEIRQAVVP